MENCRWRDAYDICRCGYSEFIEREVNDEDCDQCIDNTNYEQEDEDTGELSYED